MGTVFRPYSDSDSLQSDRSSGDRQRHRDKVKESIRENIADIVAEESIIGREGDQIIKVPIRGIKEYRFVYGDNTPGVGQGDGDTQEGDVVGKTSDKKEEGVGAGGNEPGTDYYETDVTIEEIINLMFEDLELPDLERKTLRQTISQKSFKRKGYRKQGIRVHLDKKRTVKSRIKRKIARERIAERDEKENSALDNGEEEQRFPFHYDDMRYRRRQPEESFESNAVVICLMDTSGSMDNVKKYLARSFFFLLYQFVRTRYEQVDLLFVAHDTRAVEVDENDFFHKGQSGGTMISSGYEKVLNIIEDRYHPSMWNVYCFHCSDGDNFSYDNDKTVKLAEQLCKTCNLFGYGEIKPGGGTTWEGSIIQRLEDITAKNFEILKIEGKEDIWPAFKNLLSKDKEKRFD